MSVANTEPAAILSAMVTALQAIDGGVGYHYDVSSAVQIGHPAEPPTAYPCAFVGPGSLELDEGRPTPLGQYRFKLTMRLYMFVAAASSTAAAGTLAGYNAMMDLLMGATASRTLGGLVHLMHVDGRGVVPGNEADGLGVGRGVALVDVSVEWTRSLG